MQELLAESHPFPIMYGRILTFCFAHLQAGLTFSF